MTLKDGETFVDGLAQKAKRKLFLTGTPVLNKPIELHPLLSVIAPETFGNFWTFARRYCGAQKTKYGWQFNGATHLEELQEKLRATCMVRRLKVDVLKELPAKTRNAVILPANGASKFVTAEMAAMADVLADVEIALANGDEDAWDEIPRRARLRFEEISAARARVGEHKVKPAVEYISDALESTAKIIVFAHHKKVIAGLVTGLAEYGVVSITGDTPNEDRQAAVDAFQNDPNVRVFVGSIGACREGLTLTAASTVVFVELDWVPANMNQAEDRAHRIGQMNAVSVIHLVFEGSLDERMSELLRSKQGIADAALDKDTKIKVTAEATAAKARREAKRAAEKPVPEEMRAAAHRAMMELAAMCDRARMKDESGFNRIDAAIGHKMAEATHLSDGMARLAAKLATKYRRQLDPALVIAAGGKAS